MSEYVHIKMGEDIHALAGYYTPIKEEKLKFDGQDVLYIVGGCTIESSCCGGTGCMGYATVPGFLKAWQNKKNKEGLPISEVTPISDKGAREKIIKIIQEKEKIRNVDFW